MIESIRKLQAKLTVLLAKRRHQLANLHKQYGYDTAKGLASAIIQAANNDPGERPVKYRRPATRHRMTKAQRSKVEKLIIGGMPAGSASRSVGFSDAQGYLIKVALKAKQAALKKASNKKPKSKPKPPAENQAK